MGKIKYEKDDEENEKNVPTKRFKHPHSNSLNHSNETVARINNVNTSEGNREQNVGTRTRTREYYSWNYKIASWNISGIRAWTKKNGLKYLKTENPDILCLQEIKVSENTLPSELHSLKNYNFTYWNFSQKSAGHSGVGLICKREPKSVTFDLPLTSSDSDVDRRLKNSFNSEGRLIMAEFEDFLLLNAYVLNSGRGVKKSGAGRPYPPKVLNGVRGHWDRLFRSYIKNLKRRFGKPVIVAGDLNVAHTEIDIANPKTNTATAGFTIEERDGFSQLLEEAKLVDTFRFFYPSKKGAYTFWSYMHNARAKNIGWRLDYFLVSETMTKSLVDSLIRSKVMGSDHCPIVILLHI